MSEPDLSVLSPEQREMYDWILRGAYTPKAAAELLRLATPQ